MKEVRGFLIDFSPIKSGGGVQLALNFLAEIRDDFLPNVNKFILLPDVGPLSKIYFDESDFEFMKSPSSPIKRIFFEYFFLNTFIKRNNISHIYTFFGPGLPRPENVKSIVGVAYPIICYPDSPFWNHIGTYFKYKQKILNLARILRLKEASIIISETDIMKRRLIKTLKITDSDVLVFPPTVSTFVDRKRQDEFKGRFLFLSGLSPHKNLWRLYSVAEELIRRNFTQFKFLIAVTKESYLSSLKEASIDSNILSSHFQFLGTIPPDQIDEIYQSSDVLVSLSDLESFSNNYMEAWKAGLPLIVSDRDFARAICGDSAIYVEPHDIENIAKSIITISESSQLRFCLVENGDKLLMMLPTMKEKVKFLTTAVL